MCDEPQEWYKLIRKRLQYANFPRYTWHLESYYQTDHTRMSEAEYRRLSEGNWQAYDEKEATQRQAAMENYFREWPLSK